MRCSMGIRCGLMLACTGVVLLAVQPAFGEEANYADLARKVVTVSAKITPGEVVVIYGGKHTIPLMEALAIEAQKAGGLVQMLMNSDRVARSYFTEVPEKYLGQEPKYLTEWLKPIDVWIGLPDVEDAKSTYGDVPEGRFAKASKAGQVVTDMLNQTKARVIFIGFPTKEDAAIDKIDFAAYEKMHWDAVNADYGQISQQGEKLKKILQGAKTVKVTAPAGTNFSFSVGDRPVFVDDGIVSAEKAKSSLFQSRVVSLPGGSVYLAPLETSANGRVVVPRDVCRFAPITGVTFEFVSGKLQNFKAEAGGSCYTETMAPYAGPKDMFGYFSVGLNTADKVVESPGDYRPDRAAGMVYIGIGDNRLLAGKNNVEGQGGFGFPVVKATVEVDGKVVVKDGRLVF